MIPHPLYSAILVVAVTTVGAQAGGYNDFNMGIAARNRDDNNATVTAFSRALAAGDLAPSLRTVALMDRAWAYRELRQYNAAISDFSAVIAEKPSDFEALRGRVGTYERMGQFENALPDCKVMVSLAPTAPLLLAWCGHIAFDTARFELAETYLGEAVKFGGWDPHRVYNQLWLGLSYLKAGKAANDQFAAAERIVDRGKWPEPIIEFFLGRNTEADVNSSAAVGDTRTQQNQKCEAGFYLGEWKLAYQKLTEAKSLFQQAVDLCPGDFIELDPAKAELAKLQQGDKQ